MSDSIDGSPPGSPIPGFLQARTLEWVAISFSNAWKWKVKSESEVAQSCLTLGIVMMHKYMPDNYEIEIFEYEGQESRLNKLPRWCLAQCSMRVINSFWKWLWILVGSAIISDNVDNWGKGMQYLPDKQPYKADGLSPSSGLNSDPNKVCPVWIPRICKQYHIWAKI